MNSGILKLSSGRGGRRMGGFSLILATPYFSEAAQWINNLASQLSVTIHPFNEFFVVI